MRISDTYDEHAFRNQVSDCLEQTRKILRDEKQLTTLDKVAHKYADKYHTVESLGKAAIACYLNSFSTLGLSEEDTMKLVSWSECLDVTLHWEIDTKCVFVNEAKRDIENAIGLQTEVVGIVDSTMKTSTVITTVIDYYYLFTARYQLVAYRGVGDTVNDRIVLQSRSPEQDIVISSAISPYPGATNKHLDLNISWLLRQIDSRNKVKFSIDRDKDDCHTPSRNKEVSAALEFFMKSDLWWEEVWHDIESILEVQTSHESVVNIETLHDQVDDEKDVTLSNMIEPFVPVFPLVGDEMQSTSTPAAHLKYKSESKPPDNQQSGASDDISLMCTETTDGGVNTSTVNGHDPPTISKDEFLNQLLSEHARRLQTHLAMMEAYFPSSTPTPSSEKAGKSPMISAAEVKLSLIMLHMATVGKQFRDSVQFMENMLHNQLVAAVGKTLQASDFTAYMRYHNRKLFKDEFQPLPFNHAVRRTAQHSPEGSIRIEEQSGDSMIEPIYTACSSRSASSAAPMQFALNASTNITFGGDRHLHTYLAHSFNGQHSSLELVAEARQFSSFIVLVGRIVSANVFEPKHGMIVQNKDEITIPLHLEQIPTPKQFRDAIESLSPEQQRFAKVFRGMQLESTLFAVLVLQIKPQLEMVLKLSTDTLTKEIKLTQDLMEMFIKYQIPSDLLSYDESSLGVTSPENRLNAVKEHVTSMHSMISLSKSQVMEDQELEESYAHQKGYPEYMNLACCGVFSRVSMLLEHQGVPFGVIESCDDDMAGGGECGEKPSQLDQNKNNKVDGEDSNSTSTSTSTAHQNESKSVSNNNNKSNTNNVTAPAVQVVDFTKFPKLLDRRYEMLDTDSVLRPTIISPGSAWDKKSRTSLLSEPERKQLHRDDMELEKNAAFDLIDAISKSGALVMHSASLHVVIAATHNFDKSLMDTLVQGNVNPIERVERSALIMASTIHERSASDLISEDEKSRVLKHSPQLNKRKNRQV